MMKYIAKGLGEFELGEIISQGGEGAVYAILGYPHVVVKIYHTTKSNEDAYKLVHMVDNPPSYRIHNHTVIAWPLALVATADTKQFAGYIMPHINQAMPLVNAYNPILRRDTFTNIDKQSVKPWLFWIARNLSSAFHQLHAADYVIGDLNESNILVNEQAMVTLVDIDSIQVTTTKHVYYCEVGRPEYTPPEMQDHSFKERIRAPEQDHFGMAVLIFHVLTGGSHPFRSVWVGQGEQLSLREKIQQGLYPYGGNHDARIQPHPKLAKQLERLPTEINALFTQCFVAGHSNPSARPSASDWMSAFAMLQIPMPIITRNAEQAEAKSDPPQDQQSSVVANPPAPTVMTPPSQPVQLPQQPPAPQQVSSGYIDIQIIIGLVFVIASIFVLSQLFGGGDDTLTVAEISTLTAEVQDSDGDGVLDSEDVCPFEENQGNGIDEFGCPLPERQTEIPSAIPVTFQPTNTQAVTTAVPPVTVTPASSTEPKVIFEDHFTDNGNGWETATTSEVVSDILEGQYFINLAVNNNSWWVWPGWQDNVAAPIMTGRYEAEVQFRIFEARSSNAGVGMIYNVNESASDNFYITIDHSGNWERRNLSGTTSLNRGRTKGVETDTSYTMRLLVEDESATFYIDDRKIATIQHDQINGTVGFGVIGDVTVSFDDFVIRYIDSTSIIAFPNAKTKTDAIAKDSPYITANNLQKLPTGTLLQILGRTADTLWYYAEKADTATSAKSGFWVPAHLVSVDELVNVTLPIMDNNANYPGKTPITVNNIEQLEEITILGNGGANQIAISSDERVVAVATTIGLWFLDVKSGTKEFLQLADFGVSSMAFSPLDASTIAIGDNTGIIYVCTHQNKNSCKPLVTQNTNEAHEGAIADIAYSSDGSLIASVGKTDGFIRIWSSTNGQMLNEFSGHTDDINAVAFSPNINYVVTASEDETLRLWNLTTDRLERVFTGHSDGVHDVIFSPDGRFIYSSSGYQDQHTFGWNIETGEIILEIDTGYIPQLAITQDGNRIISGGQDGIRLWDIESGNRLELPSEWGQELVISLAMNDDSELVVTANWEGTVRLRKLSLPDDIIQEWDGFWVDLTSVAVSDANHLIAAGSRSRQGIHLWDSLSGQYLGNLTDHNDGSVEDVKFTADSNTLISGSQDGTVRFWDVTSDYESQEVGKDGDYYTGWIWNVALSPDQSVVASPSTNDTIGLWDIQNGENITTLEGHTDAVWDADFSPDGRYLVSGSSDNTAIIWDVVTFTPIETLQHNGIVETVAFSPDGHYIATGADRIYLWDAQTFQLVSTFNRGNLNELIFSPDSKLLLAGSYRVTVIDVPNLRIVDTFRGNNDWIWGIDFNEDMSQLYLSGSDGAVHIYGIP